MSSKTSKISSWLTGSLFAIGFGALLFGSLSDHKAATDQKNLLLRQAVHQFLSETPSVESVEIWHLDGTTYTCELSAGSIDLCTLRDTYERSDASVVDISIIRHGHHRKEITPQGFFSKYWALVGDNYWLVWIDVGDEHRLTFLTIAPDEWEEFKEWAENIEVLVDER